MAPNVQEYILAVLSLLLDLPSVFLYLVECIVVIAGCREHFNSCFYKLFLASALNNILFNFIGSFFYGRLQVNWVPKLSQIFVNFPGWLAGIFFALQFYCQHADNLLLLFTLVQRLTTILRPFDSEKIWRLLFPLAIFISFVAPFALMTHLFGLQVKYAPLYENDTYVLDYDHKANPEVPNNSQILFITSSTFLVICVGLNVAIFIAYRVQKAQGMGASMTNGNGTNNRVERNLLLYTIIVCGAQALNCIYWIGLYVFRYDQSIRFVIYDSFVLVNDLRAVVIPPWFLLWASSDMSKRIGDIFWRNPLKLKKNGGGGIIQIPKGKNIQRVGATTK